MFKGWTIEIALYRLLNPMLELTSKMSMAVTGETKITFTRFVLLRHMWTLI